MRTTNLALLRHLACVLSLVVLASCASRDEISSGSVVEEIIDMTAGATLAPTWYSSPLEATPLTKFVVDGVEQSEAASDLLVVGRVTGVTAGTSYSWPTGPGKTGGNTTSVTHAFNHENAWMSTVHLSVSVESTLPTDATLPDTGLVSIGLALLSPVDVDALATELVGRRIATPLHANDKSFFSGESGVYGILLAGEMLGFIDDEQRVSFPALKSLTHAEDGEHSYKLSDLLNPPARVALRTLGGEYIKVTEADESSSFQLE